MLIYNKQGTPVLKQFDDVYFSNQMGCKKPAIYFLTASCYRSALPALKAASLLLSPLVLFDIGYSKPVFG
jgi:tRNA U34 5-methylaminomethyl-2-thiouridine-forming methyltransferase MnmC